MLAVRVVEVGVNASNVNNLTWMVLKGDVNDGLEDALHLCRNELVAFLSRSKAKSSTFRRALWATSPADWTDAISFFRAVWVAQGSTFYEFWWANQRFAFSLFDISVIRLLST